ncbi:MAG: NAD(+) synthase [Clostridiales bacterium]|nr:NAD(+) synthase [Clostridiales bacterium]
MQYGFVKACAATPDVKVADVKFNTQNIIADAFKAEEGGSQLTVFPELCVSGYTCGDLFNQPLLIKSCEEAVAQICEQTKNLTSLIFIGVPVFQSGRLYNCAVAINCGKVLGVIPKKFLPNYNEFYEARNFSPAQKGVKTITYAGFEVPFGMDIIFEAKTNKNFAVAAEICEDLWAPLSPSVSHATAGANIIVNLSCSSELVAKQEHRKNLVKVQSAKLLCGYIYSNAGDGESSTDMVFGGHNIICENGEILAEKPIFKNGLLFAEIDVEKLNAERVKKASTFYYESRSIEYTIVPFVTNDSSSKLERHFPKLPFVPNNTLAERAELILNIQAKGLEKRLKHTGAKTAVIGISGGLDSSLAFLVVVRAFKALNRDTKNIIAVTMPGFGTTKKTLNNSKKLIKYFGAELKEISIVDGVLQHFKDIGHDPDILDVTYENAQARYRTMLLMDIANKTGGLVIGTGDLSESALGWSTYNGDHMSMYGVNCSVPKTLVKHLVKHEAQNLGGEAEGVLNDILGTEISPELLPPEKSGEISQKTEDLVGPYVLHDFFLYYAIRYGFTPSKIKFIAERTFKDDFSPEEIEKWLKIFYKRFFAQQFKRSCVPDGIKVGSVALSPRGDWKMPSDALSTIWLQDIENK